MKIGINRNKIDLEIADKTYTIGIVPVHVNYLIAKHDENESKEFDQEKHDTQLSLMRECMKDLLESNGYEYDEKWLESKLDLLGMQEFVVACLAKDIKLEAKKSGSKSVREVDFDKLYYALKAKNLVGSKEEFYYQMDLHDIEDAGAFISREIWDSYILKKSEKITVKPRDYTK